MSLPNDIDSTCLGSLDRAATNMTCSCATQEAIASTAIVTFTGILKMTLSKEIDYTQIGSLNSTMTIIIVSISFLANQGAKASTLIVTVSDIC